ncbi:hypothetical protein [Geodermatophilus sp. URMC 62]|uniref:hypothetical protein n=1 Tax=Geodermatophilus sp. URMC 62 TaxID=3423414 RepID=UPI00406BE915
MGRSMQPVRLSTTEREEVELARTVDAAVTEVLRTGTPTVEDEPALTERLLTRLDGAVTSEAAPPATRAQPPSPVPMVQLDGLEVTQGIQDPTHTVPLVADRPTVVRAYLRYARAAVTVRGELLVARSANGPWQSVPSLGAAELDPSRSGSSLAELRSRRLDLAYSLNFLLPAQCTGPGPLWLRMGRVLRTTGSPLPSLAGLTTRSVTFGAPVPLRMRLVRVRYSTGTPPVTHEPSTTDTTLIASWLRRAYPISRLHLSSSTVTATAAAPFGAAQVNAQLLALRAIDVSTGTDARTHYYGMVADSGFFMRGLASGIPQTPQPGTVASGPTGPSTFGWDGDGSYGDWYGGHELAHTLGRFHAEFCGAAGGAPYPFPNGQLSDADDRFVGIDVGDPALGLPLRVLPGTTSHDVMTYCDNQWLSSFTYGGVHARLVAEDALPAGSAAPETLGAASGEERAGMRIVAALDLTRAEGTIVSVLPDDPAGGDEAEDTGAATPEAADGAARVSVRIRDAAGEVLDERPVTFRPSVCEDPDDDLTGVVDSVVPSVEGAAQVELLVDGQPVAAEAVGGQTGDVGELLTSRAAGAGEPGGPLEVRWDTGDAPRDQRYIVQLSEDGGGSWRTVAVGLTEPATTVPADEVSGDEVTVRLLATTGTRTTVLRTETVPVR